MCSACDNHVMYMCASYIICFVKEKVERKKQREEELEIKKKKQDKLNEELKEEESKKKKKEMAELEKRMAEDKLEALKKTPIGAKVFNDLTAEVS